MGSIVRYTSTYKIYSDKNEAPRPVLYNDQGEASLCSLLLISKHMFHYLRPITSQPKSQQLTRSHGKTTYKDPDNELDDRHRHDTGIY
jgi:hypothetical protein